MKIDQSKPVVLQFRSTNPKKKGQFLALAERQKSCPERTEGERSGELVAQSDAVRPRRIANELASAGWYVTGVLYHETPRDRGKDVGVLSVWLRHEPEETVEISDNCADLVRGLLQSTWRCQVYVNPGSVVFAHAARSDDPPAEEFALEESGGLQRVSLKEPAG